MTQSTVFLDHHSRLGDQFIMNGAIREYCKRYDKVGIFSIPKYHAAVSYMFRDLKNLHIELAPTNNDRRFFALKNLVTRRYDRIVYARGEDLETGILFELQFYKMVDVNHEKKWSNFFVAREPDREKRLFEKLAGAAPYIFIHDDARFPIDASRIESVAAQVRPEPSLTDNVFDYCSLIEQAEEIHAIDSSFMFLIDQLSYDNPKQKLFVHRYARTNAAFTLPILKKPWVILQ
jgi:hypothetical protein